jgi:hypothetical protein
MRLSHRSYIYIVVSSTLAAVLGLLSNSVAMGQTAPPPPQLTSISAINSGGKPSIVFSFDSDVRAYAASTFTIKGVNNGVITPFAPQLVSFAGNSPKTITVPLDFAALGGDDSVQVSVTLANALVAGQPQTALTVPFYSLDLAFLKVVAGYQSQLQTLTQANQGLQSQLKQTQADMKTLIARQSPTTLNYLGAELVGDTSFVIHISTDKYGAVLIQNTESTQKVTDYGTDHHITFANLAPGAQYHLTAAALDIADKPVVTNSTIVVGTKPSVAFAPTFKAISTSPSTMTVNIDPNPMGTLPPNFKAYFSVQYRQIVDAASGIYGAPQTVGDGDLNGFGVPVGTSYTGKHEFTITALSPKTSYAVSITAIDEYGHKFVSPSATVAMIDPVPPLDFDGPIQVSLNTNTGLTVSWKANRAIKTATMAIQFTDNTSVEIDPKATASSKDVSVSTDLAGLVAVLQKTQEKKMTPIIKITMSDGTETKSQSLSVEFVVPGKSTAADPKVKTAVNNVAAAEQNPGKKVSWADVINTGLGILVKVL